MTVKTTLSFYVKKLIQVQKKTTPAKVPPKFVPDELTKKVEELSRLTGAWNPVELLTPDRESAQGAQEAMYYAYQKDKEYNPVLTYPHVYDKVFDVRMAEKLVRLILSDVHAYYPLSPSEIIARRMLLSKVNDDLATIQLIKGLRQKNETLIHMAISVKYPNNSNFVQQIARTEYKRITRTKVEDKVAPVKTILTDKQRKVLRRAKINSQEIKEAFEWLLAAYGMLKSTIQPFGYRVVLSSRVTHIDVRDKSQEQMTIYIPKNRTETADNLLALMYHEIEAHARQSMNGFKLLQIGGGVLKIDDETMYEGLAKRLDDIYRKRFFGIRKPPLPFYALAVQKAEEGAGFYEVFTDQVNRLMHHILKIPHNQPLPYKRQTIAQNFHFVLEYAWENTLRVMRGHIDTVNATGYAFTKDLAYLRGWHIDKQLVELGLGHLNEAAVLKTGTFPLLGGLAIKEDDLPYKFRNLTEIYCFEVLLPKLERSYIIKQ